MNLNGVITVKIYANFGIFKEETVRKMHFYAIQNVENLPNLLAILAMCE